MSTKLTDTIRGHHGKWFNKKNIYIWKITHQIIAKFVSSTMSTIKNKNRYEKSRFQVYKHNFRAKSSHYKTPFPQWLCPLRPSSIAAFRVIVTALSHTDANTLYITLRPRQNGRHFADDIFKCIFLNGNVWIPIIISIRFVPKGPNNNIPALVQIMAWRRPGDKPLSEPMMVSLTTHICVTRPQWDIPHFIRKHKCVCVFIKFIHITTPQLVENHSQWGHDYPHLFWSIYWLLIS